MKTSKLKELVTKGKLKYSHTSLERGYISRKPGSEYVSPYSGKFGKGYTLHSPNWESCNYSHISYYIKPE